MSVFSAIIARGLTLLGPTADGSAGQVLSTDGAGALSFATAGGGRLTELEVITASGSASVDFVSWDTSFFDYYIDMLNVTVASDSSILVQTSDDAGVSFEAGSTDYARYMILQGSNLNPPTFLVDATSTGAQIAQSQGGAAGEHGSGYVRITRPNLVSVKTLFAGKYSSISNAGNFNVTDFGGARKAAEATDGLRIIASAGNISGTFILYGVSNGA